MGSESVSVLSVPAEDSSVCLPASEAEESSVIIEWDDYQPLIELIHPSFKSAQLLPASLPIVADPTIMPAPCAASRLAPTENELRPALTTENEHRLAPMNRLTKQNSIRRALPEPLPIVHLRLAPFRPPE
ncbi:MAG: hypothetical protein GY847_01845 [Proteobacteria bacterium]|nr:hypothetical protein [Pseudomonadota bacterium]